MDEIHKFIHLFFLQQLSAYQGYHVAVNENSVCLEANSLDTNTQNSCSWLLFFQGGGIYETGSPCDYQPGLELLWG